MTSKKQCPTCGSEIILVNEDHYIARDDGKVGMMSAFTSNDETQLYDAFDCKRCGCQLIIQKRKRKFIPYELDECDKSEETDTRNIDDGK